MRRGRSRPWAVRWFTLLFLAAALLAWFDGMRDLQSTARYLSEQVPALAFGREATIVVLSARLSIALIPIALIWFLASNFVRWMVAVLALVKLVPIFGALGAGGAPSFIWTASLVLGLLGAGLLFTRSARRYFAGHEPLDRTFVD